MDIKEFAEIFPKGLFADSPFQFHLRAYRPNPSRDMAEQVPLLTTLVRAASVFPPFSGTKKGHPEGWPRVAEKVYLPSLLALCAARMNFAWAVSLSSSSIFSVAEVIM